MPGNRILFIFYKCNWLNEFEELCRFGLREIVILSRDEA